jgi:hypothetical protein
MGSKSRPVLKPPPRTVKTIRDLILWEYAKLMAEAAGMSTQYGFIMSRFKKLQAGEIQWKDIDRDAIQMQKEQRICVYCGSKKDLSTEHIIPVCKGGLDIPANTVLACSTCNSSKGGRDVFEWSFEVRKETKVPRDVWKRYLKLVWEYHTMHRTLDRADLNKDGTLNLLDLGAIFQK